MTLRSVSCFFLFLSSGMLNAQEATEEKLFDSAGLYFFQKSQGFHEWLLSSPAAGSVGIQAQKAVKLVFENHMRTNGLKIEEFDEMRASMTPDEFRGFMSEWKEHVRAAELLLPSKYDAAVKRVTSPKQREELERSWLKNQLIKHGTRVFESQDALRIIEAPVGLADDFLRINKDALLHLDKTVKEATSESEERIGKLRVNGKSCSKLLLDFLKVPAE